MLIFLQYALKMFVLIKLFWRHNLKFIPQPGESVKMADPTSSVMSLHKRNYTRGEPLHALRYNAVSAFGIA